MPFVRREQVFVSSTFLDLKDERQEVMQTLLEAGCIPAGMELFPASDDQKWTLIKRIIDDCDYYVVVIGGRYGSVDPVQDLGYVEQEFDYAHLNHIPIMGFLHENPGSLPMDKSDIDPDLRDRLDRFRAKVEDRMVKYWTSPKDLGGQVAKSLIQMRNDHPAEGWVRARDAVTPELHEELVTLRARVSELTGQLAQSEAAHRLETPTIDLAGGDDTYDLSFYLRYLSKERSKAGSARYKGQWYSAPISWDGLLFDLGPLMLNESSEGDLDERLDQTAGALWNEQGQPRPDDYQSFDRLTVSTEVLPDVVVQFMALGLIERSDRRRGVSNDQAYWRLTDHGRRELMRVRAFERSESADAGADKEGTATKKAATKKAATKKAATKKAATKNAATKPATRAPAAPKKASARSVAKRSIS